MNMDSEKRSGAYVDYDDEEENEATGNDRSRRGRYESSELRQTASSTKTIRSPK